MAVFGLDGQTLKKLVAEEWTEGPAESLLSGKRIVCFYFSATWCPPCRAFTPMLKDAYDHYLISTDQYYDPCKDIEVVFVSYDRTDEEMINYMKECHGKWLAVSRNSDLAISLSTKFGVQSIPALIVCKSDGSVLTTDGRADVQKAGSEGIKHWFRKL